MGWLKNLISYFKQTLKEEKYTRWLTPQEVDTEVKWVDDEKWELVRKKNIAHFFEGIDRENLEQIRNMAIYDVIKSYAELEYYPGSKGYEAQCNRAFLRKVASYKLVIKVINNKLKENK